MKFSQKKARAYFKHKNDMIQTTHLAIGAHPDDLEIMAYHGILQGRLSSENHFTGVVVCDGAGSPRSGKYSQVTDLEMISLRQEEQIAAATLGQYSAVIMLAHTSQQTKDTKDTLIVDELVQILEKTKPHTVYLHNLADKHDTHVAVSIKSLLALRKLEKENRPKNVFGCEVWRDLDWLPDQKKQVLPVSQNEELAEKIILAHDSQVSGGKRYNKGALGRRMANATFFESSSTDQETMVSFAMDLKPLVDAKDFAPEAYVAQLIEEFKADVVSRIKKSKV